MLFGVTYCESLQNGGAVAPTRPLASKPLDFGQKHDATVDIPLDAMNVMKFLFPLHFYSLNTHGMTDYFVVLILLITGSEEKRKGACSLGS